MTIRSMTAKKEPRQWQVRDRLNRAWRWPLYSRVRAIGTLAAALAVVVIWPQVTGSSRDTSASTSTTGPASATTPVTWLSTSDLAATATTGADGQVAVTEAPSPPVLTPLPADYATPETVAAKYLQAWCYQPVGSVANTNITTAAAFMTAAGLADDQSRAPTRPSALTSICGPVTVTPLGEQPSTPDRALLALSTHQVLLNPAGSIIGQQMLEQTRRILRGPDGRWLVDVQVRAG
jgi:hypothetical protein